MDEFVGVIKNFGGTFAPTNWLFCSGQSLPISQYEVLYTLIGTTFGGDGVTTFNLPNLNGAVPVGTGRSAVGTTYPQGAKGGSNEFTMTVPTMPQHSHALTLNAGVVQGLKANGTDASTPEPNGNIPATGPVNIYGPAGDTPMGALVNNIALGTAGTPTPAAVDNRTPFMALNYIICTDGIWPSSN